MAKKGDALIWHADLMHGGAMIEDPASTRMSFIAHFMPLGVMPTFYDFSGVNAIPYRKRRLLPGRLPQDRQDQFERGHIRPNG